MMRASFFRHSPLPRLFLLAAALVALAVFFVPDDGPAQAQGVTRYGLSSLTLSDGTTTWTAANVGSDGTSKYSEITVPRSTTNVTLTPSWGAAGSRHEAVVTVRNYFGGEVIFGPQTFTDSGVAVSFALSTKKLATNVEGATVTDRTSISVAFSVNGQSQSVNGFLVTKTGDLQASLPISGLTVNEGEDVTVTVTLDEAWLRLDRAAQSGTAIPLTVTNGSAEDGDWAPYGGWRQGKIWVYIPTGAQSGSVTFKTAQDADTDDDTFTVALDTANLPSGISAGASSVQVTITDDGIQGYNPSSEEECEPKIVTDPVTWEQVVQPCDEQEEGNADLIAQLYQWRSDLDQALLALGETVPDTSLTAMTAVQAHAMADEAWLTHWAAVSAAIRELENQAPTVASAIADATIVNESGTQSVSLSGVFNDADSDILTITAVSSNNAVATASVSSDYSTLTVTAQSRGTATITVTANDGTGGTVSDDFTVAVKAAPTVASPLPDVSGLTAGTTRDVSLSGIFTDADGDSLTVTAGSSDEGVATVSVASDYSKLTLAGVAQGTATITVTARDADGNTVSDTFDVSAAPAPQPNNPPTVASAIGDATIVNESGTHSVSLSGVFSDADNDSLIITAGSSNNAVAAASVSSDQAMLTVSARSRGTAMITVTAEDGNGGTVSDSFTVTVKAAPVVAQPIGDLSLTVGENTAQVSLSDVFSDADGDALTYTAESDDTDAVILYEFLGELTVAAEADGTATVTVTARDSDGNTVSDSFEVTVTGPPTPAANLRCIAKTDQVAFLWDAPEWSGGEVYAYDYELTMPDGGTHRERLRGYGLVNRPGSYQAGQEASISVKVVYELADGSEVSSEAATLTCTVAE